MNRNANSRARRGFSIVEVAIVLVAFLLAVGGVLIPFGQRLAQDQYDAAELTARQIKAAVMDYAARARTRGRWLEVEMPPVTMTIRINAARTRVTVVDSRLIRIPPGRPYLPCPDINGDGVEDRLINADLGIAIDAPLTPANLISQDESAAAGNCAFYKGMAPWRTLGTPPSDPWGNRFLYRVDPIFAQAAVGFDESSSADAFDPRAGLTVTTSGGVDYPVYRRREDSLSGRLDVDIDGESYNKNADMELLPNIVCYGTPGGGDDERSGCVDGYQPLAGQLIPADVEPSFDNPRPFQEDDIADAPPVVIVSTGKNGYYGVNHQASEGGDIFCAAHPGDPDEGSLGEYQNAVWGELNASNFAGNCIEDEPYEPTGVSDTPTTGVSFSRQPRGEYNDDIVEWLSAAEIKAELGRRGVFPAPPLPRY